MSFNYKMLQQCYYYYDCYNIEMFLGAPGLSLYDNMLVLKQSLICTIAPFLTLVLCFWLYLKIFEREEFYTNPRFMVKPEDKPILKYQTYFRSKNMLVHNFISLVFTTLLYFMMFWAALVILVWYNIFIVFIINFYYAYPVYFLKHLYWAIVSMWFYILDYIFIKKNWKFGENKTKKNR